MAQHDSRQTPPKPISDTELEILKLLWELGSGTVRKMQEILEGRDRTWAYTTVQTLLQRLEAKGYVEVSRAAVPHIFRSAVSQRDLIDLQLNEVAAKVCDGRATPLVLSLVESHSFSSEDIQKFRSLLDGLEEESRSSRKNK